MISLDDTIATIGTPAGAGGIGIVRLSGPESGSILSRIFVPDRTEPVAAPRCLCYGWIVEPDSGTVVDEVLAVFMPAPRTYTRQDVVEINGHGGTLVLRRILELTLSAGARLAEPGEFTLRAFANGRIDLSQAEAVRDTIAARTARGLDQALGQLQGRLGGRIREIRNTLRACLASLEVGFDFEEEDGPTPDLSAALTAAVSDLEGLLSTAGAGMVRREGVRVAIAGSPNVGKSSLLNALLREDRAIVTDVPGTTRDTLEETADIQGLAVIFVDTAGLSNREGDPVERMGMARARRAIDSADLVLLVLDAGRRLQPEDRETAQMAAKAPGMIVVWNKTDLREPMEPSPVPGVPEIRVSALTGAGLPELEDAILAQALGPSGVTDGVSLTSERHREAVSRALEAAKRASLAAEAGLPADLVALDLRLAMEALGEVTGETVHDEILSAVFATFCVGK